MQEVYDHAGNEVYEYWEEGQEISKVGLGFICNLDK